jgi:hypothetical protein
MWTVLSTTLPLITAERPCGFGFPPNADKPKETQVYTNEARRIRTVYAERDRTEKSNAGNPGRERMLRERLDAMESVLGARLEGALSEFHVIDTGCSKRSLLGWFHEGGVPPQYSFGIDLSPDRIRIARETYPGFAFVEGEASVLPSHYFGLLCPPDDALNDHVGLSDRCPSEGRQYA